MTLSAPRQSNIELLRIICFLGVIILHYANPILGGGLLYVKDGGGIFNELILMLLTSIFVCAVNVFVCITGYFMSGKESCNLAKPTDLLIQVIIINVVTTLLNSILGNTVFSIKHLAVSFLPKNWFVTLYIVLYLLSPYINSCIDRLNKMAYQRFLLLLLILFSVCPLFVDVLQQWTGKEINGLGTIGKYGGDYGYNIVNFIMMYVIGAYIRRFDVKCKSSILVLVLLALISAITGWAYLDNISGFAAERNAWEYCNPLVIFEAVVVFLLFKNMRNLQSRFINLIAKNCFFVYLLHLFFLRYLRISEFVTGNSLILIVHIVLSAIGVFSICWIIGWLYNLAVKPLYNRILLKVSKFTFSI